MCDVWGLDGAFSTKGTWVPALACRLLARHASPRVLALHVPDLSIVDQGQVKTAGKARESIDRVLAQLGICAE